jgi:NADH-quinone oxidoreductase subunit M
MALLALETTTMGIFASIDLILFFVFWELMLIPSYFLIKLWGGGAERHYAALKYVLYTLLGSVFMLVGIALLDINYHQWAVTHHLDHVYSFDLLELLSVPIPLSQQILIFWLMFMGFAFKAPVFPFHTWLPDALVEGPIGMAVMLAGMKLGTYGFLRFTFPLLPMHRKVKASSRSSWSWPLRQFCTAQSWHSFNRTSSASSHSAASATLGLWSSDSSP